MRIRPMAPEEHPFLQKMLYAALMWRPDGERLPEDWLLGHEQVVIFHEGWGRDGDIALVAEDEDGALQGLVWCRLFTEAIHGEGFVDESTPELAVAVVDEHRGTGVGGALMQAMADAQRASGTKQISLSVDADNPARHLYARLGYVDFSPEDGLGRMVLKLG